MSRDWRLFLNDILNCATKVRGYSAGMTIEQFVADERTYDAVLRNLELIGEAAKYIPEDARKEMPSLDWRNIAGMRNWLAHAYFGIDNAIVWNVLEVKIPELEAAITAYLSFKNTVATPEPETTRSSQPENRPDH